MELPYPLPVVLLRFALQVLMKKPHVLLDIIVQMQLQLLSSARLEDTVQQTQASRYGALLVLIAH